MVQGLQEPSDDGYGTQVDQARPISPVWIVVAVLTGLLGLLVLGLAAALRAPATTANGATLRHVARIGATVGVLGAAVGSAWGLHSGLEYPPTALVALVEGGILFGVPSVLVGVLLGLASAPFYRHRHKAAFE